MTKDNITIIRMMSNEMVIAEIVEQDEEYLTIKEPFAMVPTNDGKLTFIPWSPLSEEDTVVKMYTRNIVYYATPSQDVVQNYKEIFSNIITPQNAGKIIT